MNKSIIFDGLAEERTVRYNLDGVGNRITVSEDDEVIKYRTNNINEYVYINDKRLSYDLNGNLTLDGEVDVLRLRQ